MLVGGPGWGVFAGAETGWGEGTEGGEDCLSLP
jgi:hypothetical protein